MLKVLRWLLLLTLLLAGCGLLPTTASPTQPAAPAAGTSATEAPASPALAPPASQTGVPAVSPSPSPSPSPTPIPRTVVRLGWSASLGGWIVDVAEAQGYVAAQNLTLDRKETDPGSTAAAEDIDKRERDVGVVATDRLVQVGRNGQGLVMIAGLVNKTVHTLIAARDVPDFEALKGKPVGYLDPKSGAAGILKRIMAAKGISEGQSRLIPFPDPGVVGAAVANGTVGASLVDPTRAARLRGSGFSPLIEASEVVKEYQAEGLVVRPDWVRQNEEPVTRLLRAIVQAERWIATPANRPAAVEQLAGSLGISTAEATIAYEQYVEKLGVISREGEIDQAGVRGVIEVLGEVGAAPDPRPEAARLTDTSLLQRIRPPGSAPAPASASPSPAPLASPSSSAPASPAPSPAASPAPR